MIEVSNLTKRYGSTLALDNISFSVRRGEILGLLGPNGAGKTTTMRIIVGFLPPTEGRVVVGGYDVLAEPERVKRIVGYLPESPPLYPELRVWDYLEFVASIRGLRGAARRRKLEEALERCGLEEKRQSWIGSLSKGYRQRVGLAQAIVHDPEVLMLDEPTAGLDPRQIIEVRNLIKGLAGNHTVVLSTHILPEVSAICQRVIIINRGRLAAVDTPGGLSARLSRTRRLYVEIEGPAESVGSAIRSIDGIVSVEPERASSGCAFYVEAMDDLDFRRRLVQLVASNGWLLYELRPLGMSLEQIFVQLVAEEKKQEPEEGARS